MWLRGSTLYYSIRSSNFCGTVVACPSCIGSHLNCAYEARITGMRLDKQSIHCTVQVQCQFIEQTYHKDESTTAARVCRLITTPLFTAHVTSCRKITLPISTVLLYVLSHNTSCRNSTHIDCTVLFLIHNTCVSGFTAFMSI